MPTSDRLRELVTRSQSEDTTVSWPAARVLGLLAEQHFQAVVEALEQRHAECRELQALAETQMSLDSETGVLESGTRKEMKD